MIPHYKLNTMIDYTNNNSNPEAYSEGTGSAMSMNTFFTNVFAYMAGALTITGIVAYVFGNSLSLMSYLINFQTGGMTILGYIVMFAPLAFSLALGVAFSRFSTFGLLMFYLLFSTVMGVSLGFIFLIYTTASIATTFFITAGTFGAMAILGYTTKTDLTKMGSILYMAIIGIVIASIVNMFFKSDMFDLIISGIGVIVFTGFTAYKMQHLKNIAQGQEHGSEAANKLVLYGAITLYITFVNLFISLLRFFGDRR